MPSIASETASLSSPTEIDASQPPSSILEGNEKSDPVDDLPTKDREDDEERVVTVEITEPATVGDFPDGGLRAWSVVAGAWCISFVTWGFVSSFGVFQAYYAKNQLVDRPPSDISWIGSFETCMVLFCSIISGRAFDQGWLHYLMAGGTLIYVAGFFGLSFATTYTQLFLAHGVACGVASGIIFLPAVSAIGHFFRRNRATALGVLATGSSTGGVVYPILLNRLFNNSTLGFGWTVRIAAFLTVALLVFANLTLRTRLPPRAGGRLIDFGVFKDPILTIFCIGASLCMWGLYTPIFYLQTYAVKHGVEQNLAFYALSLLNGCSLFGRVLPNWAADYYGPLTILLPNTTLSGILIILWLPMGKSEAGLVVFSILFGFTSGAYVSMMPACVASLTERMNEMGIRLAMCFLMVSMFALTGTPISGAMIRAQGGSYTGAAVFSGVVVLVGSGFITVARAMAVKRKGKQWV